MPSAKKLRRGREAGVAVLSRAELEGMSTRELLGRLERLRRCEEDPSMSDMTPIEVSEANGIVFKSDPAWRTALDDLHDALAGRGHVSSGQERQAAREARARRNRSIERRRR